MPEYYIKINLSSGDGMSAVNTARVKDLVI